MQFPDNFVNCPTERRLRELLNTIPEPRVPSHFADDVLRRIRLESAQEQGLGFKLWLAQSWKLLTSLSGMAALLAFGLLFQEKHESSLHLAVSNNPDFSSLVASTQGEGVPDLGELDTALDDNNIWLGTDSY